MPKPEFQQVLQPFFNLLEEQFTNLLEELSRNKAPTNELISPDQHSSSTNFAANVGKDNSSTLSGTTDERVKLLLDKMVTWDKEKTNSVIMKISEYREMIKLGDL